MYKETFEVSGFGGMKLPTILWLPDGEPRRILQITHGMTEHIGRYEAFAKKLTAQGIAVAGYDLRGHGKNPGNPNVASFGEGGWEAALEDMHLFFERLSTRFPGVPNDMLGFSLGSFLLREYLGRWTEGVSRAIIMGTGYQPAPVLSIMMAIVEGQIKKGGFDHTTNLVRKLSFGTYNKKFKPNRTQSTGSARMRRRWMPISPICFAAGIFRPVCFGSCWARRSALAARRRAAHGIRTCRFC